MNSKEWFELGQEIIVEMLHKHTSMTIREFEARASNQDWRAYGGQRVDPDILSKARRNLENQGVLESQSRPTKGGRDIRTYNLAGLRNKKEVDRVAARKRLLTARHNGWSRITKRHRKGLVGEAGERSLLGAFAVGEGFSFVKRDTDFVLGHHIERGTFDTAGYLTSELADEPTLHTVVSEVKNQRQWTYATNPEFHKFLYKASQLQNAHPTAEIVPLFVSSFRSNEAWQFSRLIGCFAVRTEHQFVLNRSPLDEDLFWEVPNELGYSDLVLGDTPPTRYKRAITESLPRNARVVAERWRVTAPLCEPFFEAARTMTDRTAIGQIVLEIQDAVLHVQGPPPDYDPIVSPGR